MSRGYVLVVTNAHHYLELAVTAACSLRRNDDKPIALLIAGGVRVPARYAALFDEIVAFDPPAPYDGDFTRRFVLERYTPFDEAMHVDVDCLLIGREMDRFWGAFSSKDFAVLAALARTGNVYRDQTDVAAVVASGLAPGVYVTNWGVFYYRNTGSNAVMAAARALLEAHHAGAREPRLTYFSRPGQLSDEPIWGIAAAQVDPALPPFAPLDMLQVTSPATSDHAFDFAGARFDARKGGHPHRGQIFHFAGMEPVAAYLEGTAFYRGETGMDPPDIVAADGVRFESSRWPSIVPDVAAHLEATGRTRFALTLPSHGGSPG